jgi:hypothetical protein
VPGFIEAHGHFLGAELVAVAADLSSPPIGSGQNIPQALDAGQASGPRDLGRKSPRIRRRPPWYPDRSNSGRRRANNATVSVPPPHTGRSPRRNYAEIAGHVSCLLRESCTRPALEAAGPRWSFASDCFFGCGRTGGFPGLCDPRTSSIRRGHSTRSVANPALSLGRRRVHPRALIDRARSRL